MTTDPNLIRIDGVDRTFDRRRILVVLLLPLAMSLMAMSAVNVALPTIELGLGATPSDLQWVLSGYGLAFGVSLIPAGRAGDVMGRGSWFVVGTALFTLSSLACGLAPDPFMLNLARLAQGVASGMFSPQVTGMIQQYFTGRGRAKAFSLFGLVISAAVSVGPVVTGMIIGALGAQGWRWAFFIYIPVGVLAVVLALLWFPFETERTRRASRASGTRARLDLDPVGTVILTLAILAVMYPFMAHQTWAWFLLPAAPALGWAWVRWERRYAAGGGEPLVDLSLFAYRSFRNGTLVAGTMFLGTASTFAVLAIYLQSGLHVGAVAVGLVGLPNALMSACAAVWAVRHIMERGRTLIVAMLAVMIAGTLGSVVVAFLIPHGLPWWVIGGTLILNGLGMGAIGSANQTLSLQDVPPMHGGTAGAVKQTFERIGAAVGNAMVTGVLFGLSFTGWTVSFAVSFGVIALFLAAALAVAVMDRNQHRAVQG